jgi:hypothetical protein
MPASHGQARGTLTRNPTETTVDLGIRNRNLDSAEVLKGDKMRGNREVKDKEVKERVIATADVTKCKALTNLGEHNKK